MPSEDEHIAKAEQNEALFREFIAAGTNAEWAAVILFYAALHYVDAWLARSDVHPRSHVTRRQLVWGDQSLHRIYGHYARLDDRSRDARYEAIQFPAGYIDRLYEREYLPLRNLILRLLSQM